MRTELEIRNIVPAHSHGAYTLYLKEKFGHRVLPIIIGGFEAQAIAMELEKMKPSRPLTHDLFANTMREFHLQVIEVSIDHLEEGVYFATITCSDSIKSDSPKIKLDSRTSDAIAMATKFQCPIYCSESVMNESGFADDKEEDEFDTPGRSEEKDILPSAQNEDQLSGYSTEDLEQMLDEAIHVEDYIRAAQIRDELKRRK